ncbi:MAG: UDP-N-acetylmuramate--L-alanine ligase, partial [Tepidanaerobacteraceae bacterium]|nr:UDP-N-acetylmuramate--L-alanine ligase [Tepidanaerobacteraceae bacterium]
FQPHRYTRTQNLAKEFGSAFIDADEVIITSIYSAGEKPINGVSSSLIIDIARKNGKKFIFIENKEDIPDYIINKAVSGDYILTIGAGDISNTSYSIVDKLTDVFQKEVIGNIPEVN